MSHTSQIIGQIDPNKTIEIVGAGISGLLLGYHLKKAGYPVRIYEKSNRVGGKIQTSTSSFGLQEHAANAIYTDDNIWALIEDLNLNYILPTPKLKKKVFFAKAIKSPRPRLHELFSILLNLFKKVPRKKDQSVYDFFLPLLGDNLSKNLIGAAFIGIYACDVKELHFDSVFKEGEKNKTYFHFFQSLRKIRKEQSKPRVSLSFRNGMQEFINVLESKLKDEIVLNSNFIVNKDSNCIICTNASEASTLLETQSPELSELLCKIEYKSVNSSTIFTNEEVNGLQNSFGVLFPPNNQRKTLGILHNSEIFTNRVNERDHHSYTIISKPTQFEELAHEYKSLAINFNLSNVLQKETVEWDKGLPIYDHGRFKTVQELSHQIKNKNGIALFGNYMGGISIREMNNMALSFVSSLNTSQKH